MTNPKDVDWFPDWTSEGGAVPRPEIDPPKKKNENRRLLEWVEALESGRYEQGIEALKRVGNIVEGDWVVFDVPQFCCLGVACDLAEKDGVAHEWTYDDGEYLPPEVQSWLGISDYDPDIDGLKLTEWNDNQKLTFPEIAALIRKKYNL